MIATTATSFVPVAASPPTVLVSLSPNAQALPFVAEGRPLGVSVLSEDQARWASVFADPFPVGAPEWLDAPAPILRGASIGIEGVVRSIIEADGGARLVVCRAKGIREEPTPPLLYHRREYARLAKGGRARFRSASPTLRR